MCTSLASIVLAASFVAPTMPESTHDDTEVVTNFTLSAIRADSRVFAFALELDATPSNNVEVAFGHDADGDGMLSRSEATMLVGWNCGVWEIVDCATGDVFSESGQPGDAVLNWRLRFLPSGVPVSLGASISGNDAFTTLSEHPPQFLFSPDWDKIRIACRGMGSPHPTLTGSVANMPLSIRIR